MRASVSVVLRLCQGGMQRIGGFRDGADAAVAGSVLAANGIAARLVMDEAFGLDPAGTWQASLEVADDDHVVALRLLTAGTPAARRRWVQPPLARGVAALVLLGFLWHWALFLRRVAL